MQFVEFYDTDKIFSHFVHKISNFIIDKKVQIQNMEINYDVICNSVQIIRIHTFQYFSL